MALKFQLKNDKYRKARGGTARFLTIRCAQCSELLMIYQKDGLGSLLRCYLNRIFYPDNLEELQYQRNLTVRTMPPLACRFCGQVAGRGMHYEDGRLAYRLVPGTFSKKPGIPKTLAES